MATYVIGDIQGCFETFLYLLKHMKFNPAHDHAILLGDVINRGPGSLEIIRYVMNHEKSMSMILGNHEIYAIALALDAYSQTRTHTLHALLQAPDTHDIINWLRQQPLLIQKEQALCVHAGIYPCLSGADALAYNAELQKKLAGSGAANFLRSYFNDKIKDLKHCRDREEEMRFYLATFTLMRSCNFLGVLDFNFSGAPKDAALGFSPWFMLRPDERHEIFFGHWAALGLHRYKNYYCLDSGCGWGRPLSAMRLDDYQLFQVDNKDIIID